MCQCIFKATTGCESSDIGKRRRDITGSCSLDGVIYQLYIKNNRTMRMIRKQAAKLEELEARRERLVNRVAKLDLKIEEQKEKIAQYYRKQGINV